MTRAQVNIYFMCNFGLYNVCCGINYASAMHSMPNFAVLKGESRHESSAKQQQEAMFVSDILEKLALSPRSAHQSDLHF